MVCEYPGNFFVGMNMCGGLPIREILVFLGKLSKLRKLWFSEILGYMISDDKCAQNFIPINNNYTFYFWLQIQ